MTDDLPADKGAAPALDEIRINAMLAALQGQRDTYANQVVHLTAELALMADKLTKAQAPTASDSPLPQTDHGK